MHWDSPYSPQPHQARFHSSGATSKLFLAGVGAGKTLTGVHEAVYLMQDNPDADGLIVAPTFPMLRDVIVSLWEQWIHPSLYTHKKADQRFIWHPTGRSIFLRSADRPGRISGLNVAWAWLDEAALLLKPIVWRIMQARIRDPKAVRRCIFATTTPAGYNWLVKLFRKEGFVVRARTADNKKLPDDFEVGLRASYGEELAAQYLDALVVELAGMAWPVVPSVHSGFTAEWARANCRTFWGGTDFGHTNPAAHIVAGADDDGRMYLVAEWYKRGQTREQIAQAAKRLTAEWNVRRWYTDHDPEGVKQMQEVGLAVQLAEKKKIEPGVQYVRGTLAVRHDGQPRLFVGSWLKNWHREQDAYRFPEDKEEPIGEEGDHAMDATRYLLYTHHLTHAPIDYLGSGRARMDRDDREGDRF